MINRQIVLGHPFHTEPLLETPADTIPVKRIKVADGVDSLVYTADDEAADPLVDHLGNGPASVSDHRGPACHCLDHH